MTDADLCRSIAEKDGWKTDGHVNSALGQHWYHANGDFKYTPAGDPPDFLTDPAETVRMSKELIKRGYWPWSTVNGDKWWWSSLSHPCPHADSYERATAKAYLAMEVEDE